MDKGRPRGIEAVEQCPLSFPHTGTSSSAPGASLCTQRSTAAPSSRRSSELRGHGNVKRESPACRSHRCPNSQQHGCSPLSHRGLQRPSSMSRQCFSPGEYTGLQREARGVRTRRQISGRVPRAAPASVSVQRQFRCLERPQPIHAPLNSAPSHFCQLSAVSAATNLVSAARHQNERRRPKQGRCNPCLYLTFSFLLSTSILGWTAA